MRRRILIGLLLTFFAAQLPAAEVANLRNGFSIRHEHHETLGETTRLYMDSQPNGGYVDIATSAIESFEPAGLESQLKVPPVAADQDLGSIISAASSSSRVDADFIASVIRAESANNPRAVSHKGAQGLMQLMPATASNLGVANSFDPAQNVDGGVRYLRELLLRYDGDAAKALAAYNAGPQRVEQYKGVPPYRETHAYVARVIRDYNRKKLAEMHAQTLATRVAQKTSARPGSAASSANATTASVTAGANPGGN